MGAPPARPPLLRRALHPLTRPVLSYFDRRFEELRTSNRASDLEVITEVSRDTDTISELTLSIERLMSRYGDRLDVAVDMVDRLLEIAGWTLATSSPDSAAGLSSLIVEAPIAHAVALRLPRGSRVLVVAGAGSVLPLELASLGFQVTAPAPAGFPYLHPNLEIVVDRPSSWAGPAEPFFAAFCLSGRHSDGAADDPRPMETALHLLALIRKWLCPAGQVVLSVPLELPATYDAAPGSDPRGIDELFGDWAVQQLHVFEQRTPREWAPRSEEPTPVPIVGPRRGLAVVHACLPQ